MEYKTELANIVRHAILGNTMHVKSYAAVMAMNMRNNGDERGYRMIMKAVDPDNPDYQSGEVALGQILELPHLQPSPENEEALIQRFAEYMRQQPMHFIKMPQPTTQYFMEIKINNQSIHPLPSYQTQASAGMDLRANISKNITLYPLQRVLVPTGLFIELPRGYEAQIRPRSGLAYKHGVTVLNSPGTIDADYRGEVKVLLINLGKEPFEIVNGERIAQMVIAQHETVVWKESKDLTETERLGGFGSTGKA